MLHKSITKQNKTIQLFCGFRDKSEQERQNKVRWASKISCLAEIINHSDIKRRAIPCFLNYTCVYACYTKTQWKPDSLTSHKKDYPFLYWLVDSIFFHNAHFCNISSPNKWTNLQCAPIWEVQNFSNQVFKFWCSFNCLMF